MCSLLSSYGQYTWVNQRLNDSLNMLEGYSRMSHFHIHIFYVQKILQQKE